MKQKIIAMTAALALGAAAPFTASATGGTLAGRGTETAPYEIADYADLLAFSAKVNGGEKKAWAVLTQDIDASASSGESPWTPIAVGKDTEGVYYRGTFDGRGHIIRNLTYSNASAESVGLFGKVYGDGVVKKVGLEGGSITGRSDAGGVVGYNRGTVLNCYNTGTVTVSHTCAGGVVGRNHGGVVSGCYNAGSVSGTGATNNHIGGVVGSNLADTVHFPSAIIENCCNFGTVTGGGAVGGVAGDNSATIDNCYSAGGIVNTIDFGGQLFYAGGVVGMNNSYNNDRCVVSNAFFDKDKASAVPAIGEEYYNGGSASGGTVTNVKGLSTAQMQGAGALQNMNLDPNIWKAFTGYPMPRGVGLVTPVSYYDPVGGTNAIRSTYIPYTGETVLEGGCWYVVTGAVTVASRITVYEKVNIILCDGASLVATCGIGVLGGSTLTIWGQDGQYAVPGTSVKTRGTGVLTASTGSDQAAAIGGAKMAASGDIVINGGVVTARGTWGAGIGGGDQATNLGSVTINGGFVDASGWNGSAGIGGGGYANGCDVTISGGYVIATGSAYDSSYSKIPISQAAPGIGSGRPRASGAEPRSSGLIRILGGTVVAQAGIPNDEQGQRVTYPAQAIGVNSADAGHNGTIYPILGDMAAFSSADATEPVAAAKRGDACRGEWVMLKSCPHRRDAHDVCVWCGIAIPMTSLKAGEYFKATLVELAFNVPCDGTAYTVKAYGLPAGLKLVSNKAVTKKVKKGKKTVTVVVKPAKCEWWIEGVPTAALDYDTNPPYLAITVNDVTEMTPLPMEVLAQEVKDLGSFPIEKVWDAQNPLYLPGVTNGWTVSGLPAGLKYTAKLVTTKKMKGKKVVSVTTNALPYSVYGKPTTAGLFTITAKKKKGAYYETMKCQVLIRPAMPDTAIFGELFTGIDTMAYMPLEWDLVNGSQWEGGRLGRATLPPVPTVAKVTGLPTGLAFAASTTYKDKKKKQVKQYGQTIVGTPTKPGTYTVTFTRNVKEKVKGKTNTVAKRAQLLWTVVANDAGLSLDFNTSGGVVESGTVGLKYGDLLAFTATSNATVKASGLPKGMKLVRLDGSAGGLAPPGEAAWGFEGFTAKAGTYLVTVTATLNDKTVRQRVALKVEGLPAWAKGTYNGYVAGADGATNGLATITVSSVGKISGKFYEGGTNWTLSAASYTGYDPDASNCTATVTAKYSWKVKSGKKTLTKSATRTFSFTVAPVPVVPNVPDVPIRGVVAMVEAGVSPSSATEIDAWQNLWGSMYKAVGKKLFYASKKKPYRTFSQTVDVDGKSCPLSLKITPNGAVTATLTYDTGKKTTDKKTKKKVPVYYKPTCSTVVIPTSAAAADPFTGEVFLYFAPSVANNFPGFCAELQYPFAKRDDGRAKVKLWEGGPYWATTNIGAENPWDYGYYFWWGDTVGYTNTGSGWISVKDGSGIAFGSGSPSNSTYGKDNSALLSAGYIDATGKLVPEYDAAHVHWGGSWRMPTQQELSDLTSKCSWSETTMNGVKGLLVSGTGAYAPNSIFLPYAGGGMASLLALVGSFGHYWSSVPISDNNCAYDLVIDSNYRKANSGELRFTGQTIRPVQE